MNRFTAAAAGLALLALGAPLLADADADAAAWATGTSVEVGAEGSDTVTVSGDATSEQSGTGRRWKPPVGGGGPVVTYVLDPQLRPGPDGEGFCLYVGQQPGDPDSAFGLEMELKTIRLAGRYELCAGSAAARTSPSPSAVAAMAWRDRVSLPRPSVWMAPGRAIAGLEGCLEIGGSPSVTRDFPDVLGIPVHIEATSTYDVDWGDGASTLGTTDRGGPCPGGRLRHTYRDRGPRVITVRQRWTATWAAGGAGGRIADVLVTVGSLPLPVDEVQAVGE